MIQTLASKKSASFPLMPSQTHQRLKPLGFSWQSGLVLLYKKYFIAGVEIERFWLLCQKMALQVIQPGKLGQSALVYLLSSISKQKICFPHFPTPRLTFCDPSHPQSVGILVSECTRTPVLPTSLCTAKQHENIANC